MGDPQTTRERRRCAACLHEQTPTMTATTGCDRCGHSFAASNAQSSQTTFAVERVALGLFATFAEVRSVEDGRVIARRLLGDVDLQAVIDEAYEAGEGTPEDPESALYRMRCVLAPHVEAGT